MALQYNNILSEDYIQYLNNLPEVLEARNKIDNQTDGSIYFTINISEDIKNLLNEVWGINISMDKSIPMRWIKGDIQPHVDRGEKAFDNTHLIYLTDSPGQLIVDGMVYPITKGCGYSFSEGLSHQTINTEKAPRLLLGPMSDTGFAVGRGATLSGDGANDIIYFKSLESEELQFRINSGEWTNFTSRPIFIQNTNLTPANNMLKIIFTNNIIVNDVYFFFICSSDGIQFGSENLNDDGSKALITVKGVTDYPGFINNGYDYGNGYNNISIFNLNINISGTSTLAEACGWIGQSYFGKGSEYNFIVNCSSEGDISINGGGIVGQASGSDSGGNLIIIGCSSTGNIDAQGGGIIGNQAGREDGNVTCKSCFSSGIIGVNAGGIIGEGSQIGNVTITNCYTTGIIQSGAGGIGGPNFASATGSATITNCYTIGSISDSAGGIIGGLAVNITVTNCYTIGNVIAAAGGGISGIGGTPTITHCYTTGSVFGGTGYIIGNSATIPATCYSEADHSSSTWSSTNANTVLQNVPSTVVGTTWVSTGVNQPYELRNMGYTPYTRDNIGFTSGTPYLKSSISLTIEKGSASIAAIISGKAYTILQKASGDSGSYSTITVNSTTGVISTTSSTQPDSYTLYLRNNGSYHITQINLTITTSDPIPCLTEDTMVLTPNGYVNITKLNRGDLVITNNNKEVKIVNIFRSVVSGNLKNFPCVIPRNGIGQNYPPQELRISQYHLIKYHDLWILPKQFFPLDKTSKIIKYYHIQLENYITDNLVINDGVVVESLANTPDNIKNNVQNPQSIQNLLEYNKRCCSVTRIRNVSSNHSYF